MTKDEKKLYLMKNLKALIGSKITDYSNEDYSNIASDFVDNYNYSEDTPMKDIISDCISYIALKLANRM